MRRGLPGSAFSGRPHIAIANTTSDLTPCNAHLGAVTITGKPLTDHLDGARSWTPT